LVEVSVENMWRRGQEQKVEVAALAQKKAMDGITAPKQ
jgi:hypothetical protein